MEFGIEPSIVNNHVSNQFSHISVFNSDVMSFGMVYTKFLSGKYSPSPLSI